VTLTHPVTGDTLAPVIDVATASEILGEGYDTVLDRCRRGEIATMPRGDRTSGPWRIITAKFLRQLGLLEASA
jgi:hypothetical protein